MHHSTIERLRLLWSILGGQDYYAIFRDNPIVQDVRAEVVCIDRDQEALVRNPIKNKCIADAEAMPLPSDSCDLIVSEHVFEHFERPLSVMKECARILKTGGKLIFATPNKWCYICIIAKITPLSFHAFIKKRDRWIRDDHDRVYPTFYRMNSLATIRRIAGAAGLRVSEMRTFVGAPCYGRSFPALHRVLRMWHWLMERVPLLRPFHISLVGVLEKG